jgi:cell division septation protein DedD
MRSEPDLYKDKIEVSLDGRQIFYLFFGGAVIACLVFVLGVLVGKRVEARAHVDHAGTSAVRDPLAALDALDATTHAATPQPAPPAGQMERAVADLEGAQRQARAAAAAPAVAPVAPAAPAAAVAAAKAVVVDDEDPMPVAEPSHDDKPHGDKAHGDKADDKAHGDKAHGDKADDKDKVADKDKDKDKKKKHHDDDGAAATPAAKPADDKDKTAKADVDKKDGDKKDGDKDKVADKDKDKDKKKKARYTLQLSSFQDKAEAQAFLDSVKGAGYAAYLIEADVDGKGTFYRVRLGSYPSYDDAIDAKTEFEAKVKKVAYVTKL